MTPITRRRLANFRANRRGYISLVIFGSMILGLLSDFTVSIFERIPDLVK